MQDLSPHWFVTFAIILAVTTLRSAIVIAAAFAWSRTTRFAERRRVYRLAYAEGQLGSEFQAALTVLAFDALVLSTIRHFGLIAYQPHTTLSGFAITFVLIFLWTEIWFYFTHRMMHQPRFFWIHRQHHRAKVTDPLTSLSFSLIERSILLFGVIGFACLMSVAAPVSFAALVANGMLNYVLNVLGHSNVEFIPEAVAKSRFGGLFITPSYHAMHHARYRGHFGLFTTVLDRMFGTTYEDYGRVYDRARSGQGLARLGERITGDGPDADIAPPASVDLRPMAR